MSFQGRLLEKKIKFYIPQQVYSMHLLSTKEISEEECYDNDSNELPGLERLS